MKKLPAADRAHILHLLCEGSSIRAITRLTGASKNTVIKLMIDAGKACAAYHDEHVRGLKSQAGCRAMRSGLQLRETEECRDGETPGRAGDVWTWTAIDADQIYGLLVLGGRDGDYALGSWTISESSRRIGSSSRATATGLISRRSRGVR